MPTVTTRRRTYAHRIRDAIALSGDASLFPELDIPDSTRRTWTRRQMPDVLKMSDDDREIVDLRVALGREQKANARLRAVIRLLLALVRVLGGRLEGRRVPAAEDKERLLRAVGRTERVLGRRQSLRVLGLTPSRLTEWKLLEKTCELEDASPCPKTRPQRLTFGERTAMRAMVESMEFRHFSITSLALQAKRTGEVVASVGTWWREIREGGWKRPLRRVHPPKPRLGIRASAPNELWHIDSTRIRLLDGTKRWLHAVIDNYSRKILAYEIQEGCLGATTERLLRGAIRHLPASGGEGGVRVMTDGGSENVPLDDEESFEGLLHRVLALVDIDFSNSMIESFWNQLKNRWLYLHTLDTPAKLERLVAQYIDDHNHRIPRAALGGRTPDEMYTGLVPDLRDELRLSGKRAVADRIRTNRGLQCATCLPGPVKCEPPPVASSRAS